MENIKDTQNNIPISLENIQNLRESTQPKQNSLNQKEQNKLSQNNVHKSNNKNYKNDFNNSIQYISSSIDINKYELSDELSDKKSVNTHQQLTKRDQQIKQSPVNGDQDNVDLKSENLSVNQENDIDIQILETIQQNQPQISSPRFQQTFQSPRNEQQPLKQDNQNNNLKIIENNQNKSKNYSKQISQQENNKSQNIAISKNLSLIKSKEMYCSKRKKTVNLQNQQSPKFTYNKKFSFTNFSPLKRVNSLKSANPQNSSYDKDNSSISSESYARTKSESKIIKQEQEIEKQIQELRKKRLLNYENQFIISLKEKTYPKSKSIIKESYLKILDDYSFSSLKNTIKNTSKQNLFKKTKTSVNKIDKQLQSINIINLYQLLPCVIPMSPFSQFWSIISCIIIFPAVFVMPIQSGMGEKFLAESNFPYWKYYLAFLITFLLIDMIIVQFNKAFFKEGILVKDKKLIFKNYLNKEFVYDVISLIPLIDSLFDFYQVQFLVIIKIRLILNVILIGKNHYLTNKKKYNAFRLFYLLVLSLIICHIFSCLYLRVATYQTQKYDFENSWLRHYELENQSWIVQYLYSYYFSCMTMSTVGYGDYSPQTHYEVIFVIFSMLASSAIFAYILTYIGEIILDINREEDAYKKELFILNKYLERKNLKPELKQQVINVFQFRFQQESNLSVEDEKFIIQRLPYEMQENIKQQNNVKVLNQCKFFMNYSQETKEAIALELEEIEFQPNQVIYYDQEEQIENYNLYIIEQGCVQIFKQIGKSKKIMFYSGPKQSFGEYSFLTNQPRGFGAKATETTHCYQLNRNSLQEILSKNRSDYELFCMQKDSKLFSDQKYFISKKVHCNQCGSLNHFVRNCPYLHLISDKTKIILKQTRQEKEIQVRDTQFQRENVFLRLSPIFHQEILAFVSEQMSDDLNNLQNHQMQIEAQKILMNLKTNYSPFDENDDQSMQNPFKRGSLQSQLSNNSFISQNPNQTQPINNTNTNVFNNQNTTLGNNITLNNNNNSISPYYKSNTNNYFQSTNNNNYISLTNNNMNDSFPDCNMEHQNPEKVQQQIENYQNQYKINPNPFTQKKFEKKLINPIITPVLITNNPNFDSPSKIKSASNIKNVQFSPTNIRDKTKTQFNFFEAHKIKSKEILINNIIKEMSPMKKRISIDNNFRQKTDSFNQKSTQKPKRHNSKLIMFNMNESNQNFKARMLRSRNTIEIINKNLNDEQQIQSNEDIKSHNNHNNQFNHKQSLMNQSHQSQFQIRKQSVGSYRESKASQASNKILIHTEKNISPVNGSSNNINTTFTNHNNNYNSNNNNNQTKNYNTVVYQQGEIETYSLFLNGFQFNPSVINEKPVNCIKYQPMYNFNQIDIQTKANNYCGMHSSFGQLTFYNWRKSNKFSNMNYKVKLKKKKMDNLKLQTLQKLQASNNPGFLKPPQSSQKNKSKFSSQIQKSPQFKHFQ